MVVKTKPSRVCNVRTDFEALCGRYSISVVLLINMTGVIMPMTAVAQEAVAHVEFNQSFLRSPVDVRAFSQGNPQPPGLYSVDAFLNGSWRGKADVAFRLPTPDSRIARPCFNRELLQLLGFDLQNLALSGEDNLCGPLGSLIEGADANYDASNLRLEVRAPQVALLRNARGFVPPDQWDHGVTAATLQYNYNGYRSEASGQPGVTSHYIALRGGLNVGDWRMRMSGSGNWSALSGFKYKRSLMYAERSLIPWRSKLLLGEAVTEGRVFDSVGILGMRLESEDRMYPSSQRGFAPVVRGVANTNARVRIIQRGVQIYETTVPPGRFVIDDLYPTGSGGDLLVRVTEADGSERSFTVTYASIPELLRPGVLRYGLALGRHNNSQISKAPYLGQVTVRYGLSNLVTGYGGVLLAQGYQAASIGGAFNAPIGALALDVTHARSELAEGLIRQGQSVRTTYSKVVPYLDTNISLAMYRYSSVGYYDAGDAFLLRDMSRRAQSVSGDELQARKHRFQVSAAQTLPGDWGFLNVSLSSQNYWRKSGTDLEYQFGYSRQFGRTGISVNLGRAKRVDTSRWENSAMVTLTIPLSQDFGGASYSASYVQDRDSHALSNTLSGTLGSHSQYTYSLFGNTVRSDDSAGHSSSSSSWGGSGSWNAPYAMMSASYANGRNFKQYGANVSGALVAYSGGVVFSPMIGDTSAIVEAKNAHGARVSNYSGLVLDRGGRAVVPYLTPYQLNAVEIDPKGLSTDVELKVSNQHVAPIAGAVSLLKFETETGYSALMQGAMTDDRPLPFGAAVHDAHGRLVGNVGQAGKALLRLSELEGALSVRWGESGAQTCRIDYRLPPLPEEGSAGYRRLSSTCVPQRAQSKKVKP